VRLSHSLGKTRAVFDDPNLLPHAGLAPLMALADRAGLPDLLAGVRPGGPCGVNAAAKVACLIAGMAAGADSIDDMDLLRDGATETLFAGSWANGLALGDLPGIEQMELDLPDDVGDAGLSWFPGGEVAGFL
jgi:hypothetical protein